MSLLQAATRRWSSRRSDSSVHAAPSVEKKSSLRSSDSAGNSSKQTRFAVASSEVGEEVCAAAPEHAAAIRLQAASRGWRVRRGTAAVPAHRGRLPPAEVRVEREIARPRGRSPDSRAITSSGGLEHHQQPCGRSPNSRAEEAAAVKLQAVTRGWNTRRSLRVTPSGKVIIHSATDADIISDVDGDLDVRRVSTMQEDRHDPLIAIQAEVRQIQALTTQMDAALAKASAEMEAASRLQAGARGWHARRRTAAHRKQVGQQRGARKGHRATFASDADAELSDRGEESEEEDRLPPPAPRPTQASIEVSPANCRLAASAVVRQSLIGAMTRLAALAAAPSQASAATRLQAAARGWSARRQLRRSQGAEVCIPAAWRNSSRAAVFHTACKDDAGLDSDSLAVALQLLGQTVSKAQLSCFWEAFEEGTDAHVMGWRPFCAFADALAEGPEAVAEFADLPPEAWVALGSESGAPRDGEDRALDAACRTIQGGFRRRLSEKSAAPPVLATERRSVSMDVFRGKHPEWSSLLDAALAEAGALQNGSNSHKGEGAAPLAFREPLFCTCLGRAQPRLSPLQIHALWQGYEEGTDKEVMDLQAFFWIVEAVEKGDDVAAEHADLLEEDFATLGL